MAPMADFWQEHKTRLRGYIAKRVRESDAAGDILQDAFLKAHTRLHTVKSHGSTRRGGGGLTGRGRCGGTTGRLLD
jgi:DNA-directed RNA polymerase specialized sigma24 family protein